MQNSTYQVYYGIQIFDDLHNYFPDILYNPGRFNTVQSLLTYIGSQARGRFDLFSNAQRSQQRVQQPQQQVPIRIVRSSVTRPANPVTSLLNQLDSALPPATTYIPQTNVNDLLTTLIGLSALTGIDNGQFMEPVPVAPSQDQINRSSQLRSATAQDESVRCSICQDTYASGQAVRRIGHCSHEFHRGCIDTWFQSNVHCPICRYDIRGDDEEV